MRHTGDAIVLVGCTDADQALTSEDADDLGEDAWGPYPVEMAEEIAKQLCEQWAQVLAEQGSDAFPYGPPHAEVHPIIGARNRSEYVADIVAEAGSNWVRLPDDETLGQYVARHPVLGVEPPLGLHRLAPRRD